MSDFLIEQGMTERAANNVTALIVVVLVLATVWVLHEIFAVVVLGLKPTWLRHRPLAERADQG